MKIYTCKDRLEDIMTCIYDAWADEKRTDFPGDTAG